MSPDDFSRIFANAFGAQDADRLAAMLSAQATVMTLTGGWADGREAARLTLMAEFAGIFAHARLVTGKGRQRDIGPGIVLLHQRFVVSGAQDAEGADLPRFAAMLSAILVSDNAAWQVASLSFSGLAD